MESIAYKLNLTTRQLYILIGFVIILFSIPLSFSLVKNTQIFKSRAQEAKSGVSGKAEIGKSPVTNPKEVPATSPLSDLNKSVENLNQPSQSGAAGENGSLNTAFGPTLTLKITLEGRPSENQTAKIFVGIATGIPATKPTYVLSFTVDFPASGSFSGLSLAGLNPGSSYTAYVKGPAQIDMASTFTLSPTESVLNNGQALELPSGDLNEDNTINSADYTIALNLYGATPISSNWNERVDFNWDGVINNMDLAYVLKNFGKTGASGTWFSPPPIATGSATPATSGASLIPPSGSRTGGPASPSGGYWFYMPAL